MASSQFHDLETATHLAENDWRIGVGNPYIDAYTAAYKSYGDTIQQQKDADKAAGELFVTAACLATGSVLLGCIGSVTMEMIAKRTVIAIARKTLNDNLFRLFRTIRKNQGVAFAVGPFVDSLKDKAREKANALVEEHLHAVDGIVSPEPVVELTHMDSFMRANTNLAIRMALLVDGDATMNEVQKTAAFRQLRSAPFFGKPARRSPPFKASMAEIIELTFYLSAMLETDRLEKVGPGTYTPSGTDTATSTSQPIAQRPLAPDYPKSIMPAPTYTASHNAYQVVTVDRAGGKVQKRTNELSTKIAGVPVYSSSFFGLAGPPDTEKSAELQTADRLLSYIAVKMKPLDPFEAIR